MNTERLPELFDFLAKLTEECLPFVAEDSEPYELFLVMHVYVNVFAESYGGESFETSSDTGFRDNFAAVYDELSEVYKDRNPDTTLWFADFFAYLNNNQRLYNLPPEQALNAFFDAALNDRLMEPVDFDDDKVYQEIQ